MDSHRIQAEILVFTILFTIRLFGTNDESETPTPRSLHSPLDYRIMDSLCYSGEVSYRYENISMEDADAFFSAVADGNYAKVVSMLDEERAHVNQTDSDGFSALMIAASEGYEKIVEELIKRDCNVNAVTLNRNNTPLFFAAKVDGRFLLAYA